MKKFLVPFFKMKRAALYQSPFKTVQQAVQELQDQRKAKKPKRTTSDGEQWRLLDLSSQTLKFPATAKLDAYLELDLKKSDSISDIFIKMIDPTLIQQILARIQPFLKWPKGWQMKVSIGKIYAYLAIYIRIQGLQEVPKENQKNTNAQREAFKKAKLYFETKFPEIPKVSLDLIEKLHTHFLITTEEEKTLCNNLLKLVVQLGEYVAGDEKLFHFTGNSGFIRLCPNKPDRIGLWNYMLTAEVILNNFTY